MLCLFWMQGLTYFLWQTKHKTENEKQKKQVFNSNRDVLEVGIILDRGPVGASKQACYFPGD